VCGSPIQVIEAYTEHVGRMAALPEWTQRGLILGMTGGQQRVLDRVAQLQAAGAPVVAVWLQVRPPRTCFARGNGQARASCMSLPRQWADHGAMLTAGAVRQDWTGICNTSFAERVWWNWQLDTSLYPDWAGLAAELSHRGVALLTCVRRPCALASVLLTALLTA
jgi:alpha-glucosidase